MSTPDLTSLAPTNHCDLRWLFPGKRVCDGIRIPLSFYDEFLGEIFPTHQVNNKDNTVTIPNDHRDATISQLLRIENAAYHADIWYPDLEQISCTIPSKIMPWFDEVRKSMLQSAIVDLGGKVFVRSNAVSPKDIGLPVVEDADSAHKLMKSSSRIRSEARQQRDLYSRFKVGAPKLFLRQYRDDLLPVYEFRCFVKDDTIRGISQYDPYVSHFWLRSYLHSSVEQEQLKQRICKIVQPAIDVLSYRSMTVDVFISPSSVDNDTIIEIGPNSAWSPTGSCLYDYVRDYEQLYGSSPKETELRLATMTHNQPMFKIESLDTSYRRIEA